MIAALWARFYVWVLGAVAVLATGAGIYFKGRSAGKQVEQQKATENQLEQERARAETIQEAQHVQTEVARLPDDAVRERLHSKWQRD